ncbi:MAG: ferredoxin--NADP reductase [Hyphomicrobiales bacterium]|nr:ferredoxin--NADP reductase [Hyphomicrobiales bacterium]
MSAYTQETVLAVRHWNDGLFSFSATRTPAFRFLNGQFTMIGIEVEGKPLVRAYSMVSANYEDTLEFFSIKVPDGPLTSRLQHIKAGDALLVGKKPTGTLIIDNLLPGRVLYLLATGTGLAPFMSIIRDPDTFERFENVVLVHGCRQVADLAYRDMITTELANHEFLGGAVREKLIYYPTVTREPFENRGRITDIIENGRLFADTGLSPLAVERDRIMLCGSPQMNADLRAMFEAAGFEEGSSGKPGHFLIEKAFVEK